MLEAVPTACWSSAFERNCRTCTSLLPCNIPTRMQDDAGKHSPIISWYTLPSSILSESKTAIMKSLESYQTAHAGLFKTETCYIYHYTACNGLRFETIASSLDECRKARDRWLRSLSVSFTGHRHLSEHTDFLVLKLKNEIIRAYRTGKRFFKTGGAVGFDQGIAPF